MLNISNISFAYDKKNEIFKNLNFKVSVGQVFVILGENGAGKSTLLEIIASTLKVSSGNITFNEISNQTALFRQKLAFLSEWEMLYPKLTIQESLQLTMRLWNKKVDDSLIESLLLQYGLLNKKDVCCDSISKGMNQKLALVSALVRNPDLILLDEPFTGLDLPSIYEIKNSLKDLSKKGKTVILTTHIIPFAQDIADEILFLKKGDIQFQYKKNDWNKILKEENETLEEFLLVSGYGLN